ncbi:MAG: helix-turn-helix domain-containing protein [Candidatus Dadabacteria bacterium]|nr:helix-turn-helix domain-containing protein [Candidatus Dadabacteria bacterium]
MKFGDFVKYLRMEKLLTLREFCRKAEIDPSNWSKIERGILSPPKSKKVLKEIANVLQVKEGSDQWHTLFELASISFIPAELLEDEAVAEKLPIFFRTLRGEKPTREELEDLIVKLRES